MGRRMEALALSFLLWATCAALPFSLEARAETSAKDETESATVKAMFINVGKADAAILLAGGKYYLVDTGTKESADAMLRALSYYKVTRLTGVFLTHTDKDHIGGLKALLKSGIQVDCLYAPKFSTVELADHPVAKQAEKFAVELKWLLAGDTVTVKDSVYFSVLGPLTMDAEVENNNSLVLRLVTPQGDMLLTGDMLIQEENELLEAGKIQPAAVLKVAHHGEGDASGEALIYALKPQVAVISTDPDQGEKTPDPDVIQRLWNIGAEVYTTSQASCCIEVTLSDGSAVGRLVNYAVQ